MEKIHYSQAQFWLKAAKNTLEDSSNSNEKYAVGVAQAIHAIIKANDALTFKYLNQVAQRHDEARKLFEELIKRNFIKSEYSSYKEIIQEAITQKARAEYRAVYFSKNDAENIIRRAEKFLKMVGEII
ncbi:MAG TPA: HEPN domain-containing protein [Candidatus Nanoarchaeia archaeon]|nr:HEPN domain-containing protein [Candidatus Nanoarchaeia archaeon]